MNIDSSYFTKGLRQILNATEGNAPSAQNTAVNKVIISYIDEYSPIFFSKVLGRELAKRVMESEGNDDGINQIFDAIKYPLADYVMYFILRNSNQRSTIDGLVELKSGNKLVDASSRQAMLWNEMVDGLRLFCEDFPEMRVDQCLLTKITSCGI